MIVKFIVRIQQSNRVGSECYNKKLLIWEGSYIKIWSL